MTLAHRLLPPDQLYRLLEAGGPLADLDADPARLAAMQVRVVEVDGQIVAYWLAWKALHVEPLYIQPAFRKSPSVARHLLQALEETLAAQEEPVAYCQIDTGDTADQLTAYATRLGFLPAPGRLYYLVVEPAPTLAGGA